MVFVTAILATVPVLGASVTQPREAEAAGTAAVRGCTGIEVVLNTDEKRMFDLHNRARADRGLRRLCVHPTLRRAAEAHSRDMINRDFFSTPRPAARPSPLASSSTVTSAVPLARTSLGNGSYGTSDDRPPSFPKVLAEQ